MRLTVLNLSPSQPTTNLPAAPPMNTNSSMLIACDWLTSFEMSTNGRNVSAPTRAIESSAPIPLNVANPLSRVLLDLPPSVSSMSLTGLPMSTARRVSAAAAMNTRLASPITHSSCRQPILIAIDPATIGGAIILPRSPAKFTVPTAVERPLSSYARETILDASGC